MRTRSSACLGLVCKLEFWAALALLAVSGSAFGRNHPERIRVRVTDDAKKGVASDVYLVKPDTASNDLFLVAAVPNGRAVVEHDCQPGERIYAKPRDNATYYRSTKTSCASSVALRVTSRAYLEDLEQARRKALEANDYGKAALISNELSARVAAFDPQKAEEYRLKTLEEAARELNVENFSVRVKGQVVMSPEFAAAVSDVQRKAGARGDQASGKLDYRALRSMAGTDIGRVATSSQKRPE